MVALRVELSATWLSARYGQPALDYLAASLQVGKVGLEPTITCSQNTWASRCPTSRQSERSDLNRRSPGPRPGAITRLRHVLIVSSPCGSRTQPARLERPMTSPEVERAMLCALNERRVGLTVLEPVSPGLQPGALPSKLPTQRKNPMPCDTGLRLIPWWIDQASQAQRHRGQRIRRLIIGKRP